MFEWTATKHCRHLNNISGSYSRSVGSNLSLEMDSFDVFSSLSESLPGSCWDSTSTSSVHILPASLFSVHLIVETACFELLGE